MAIIQIECPSCPQKMRIPTDKGNLKITCQNCGYEREWQPEVMVEVRQVEFKCSANGQAFAASFGRPTDDQQQLFKIFETAIYTDTNNALDDRIRDSLQHRFDELSDESFIDVRGRKDGKIDLKEVSFNGWKCPICEFNGNGTHPMFYRCGSCKQFVCGGKTEIKGKKQIFHCYPECGQVAEVIDTGETLSEIETHNVDIRGQSQRNVFEELRAGASPKQIEHKQAVLPKSGSPQTGHKQAALPKPTSRYSVVPRKR